MGWRIVLIPLVGVFLVSSAVQGMPPQALAQQTIALGAPKWDVGDQWTWQIGNDQIIWTVLSAPVSSQPLWHSPTTAITMPPNVAPGTSGGEYVVQQKSARETGVFHVAADFSSTSASSAYFLPQFYELRFPLALGKAWTYMKRVENAPRSTSPLSTGAGVEVEVTRITEGVVSITVPGGTFEAVRIFGRSHTLSVGGGSPYPGLATGLQFEGTAAAAPDRGDVVIWYAPQVKQLVRITWQGRGFWPAQYEGASLLLVSYKLHSP